MNLDFLKDRPLVANVSGGKDSTAMALFLIDQGVDFEPVFCDIFLLAIFALVRLRSKLLPSLNTWMKSEHCTERSQSVQ